MHDTVVSLDPAGEAPEPELLLGQQIARITQERGSFAALDEQSLAASQPGETTAGQESSIGEATGNEEEKNAMDVDGEEGTAKEESGNQEGFEELRVKLASQVAAALNETALNLDFVSLLVSAARPQAAEPSMSPMLKSQTPMGSLNAETVAVPAPTPPSTSGYGWKVRAFSQSSESMTSAAERLTSEVQKERKFWHDLLETTSAGEIVNRKLRVTYGYHDSGSTYFDRGTGTFVRDEISGDAIFKPTSALERKLLQVSVYNDGAQPEQENVTSEAQTPEPKPLLVGRSVLRFSDMLDTLQEPLLSVRQARNSLFEHELMYQLIQEARGDLAAHRVKLLDGGLIVCELFGGRIEFELIDDQPESSSSPDRSLANPAVAINFGLHILLTELFRTEFEKRHGVPEPIRSSARNSKKPRTAVLLPVLARIQHSILVARTLRLAQVMLPDADITTESSTVDADELSRLPECTASARTPTVNVILHIKSPISTTNEPMVVVEAQGKKTDIYDLTELEMWLKWITRPA